MTFADILLIPIIPFIAGLLAITVAYIKKANTYNPTLAIGYMLVASAIVMEVAILALSVISMVL